MTVLPIVRVGDPVLRSRADEVPLEAIASPEIQSLIDDMIATMRDAPGVGLAAPQVGQARRIIVVEDPPQAIERLSEEQRQDRQRTAAFPLQVFVNPRLRLPAEGRKVVFPEGCLSIPGYAGLVERDLDVEIAFFDRHGTFHDWMPLTGWPARIVQHEVDHLDGVLYTDRLVPGSLMAEETMRQRLQEQSVAALIADCSREGEVG
ncbi:peptide deformylase [Labrys wisconsinensis]|uniref:Peptide deformylase n=1 Tax=Labrys wisconsinensis TaxID=425677 RepID=A0ABU0J3B4_9HYPH|nr:peptide deformylase [Labrys wisconsinensis]MDQ0468761.1 peptide deformylase [Labrys wisconsinensis]